MTNLSEKLWKRTCFSNILKKKIVFFHGHFCSFTGIASCFFHVHEFEFHGQNLMKNFTGTFLFSRALFNVFSGFFTGTVFFFTRKKNTAHPPNQPTNQPTNKRGFFEWVVGGVKIFSQIRQGKESHSNQWDPSGRSLRELSFGE